MGDAQGQDTLILSILRWQICETTRRKIA